MPLQSEETDEKKYDLAGSKERIIRVSTTDRQKLILKKILGIVRVDDNNPKSAAQLKEGDLAKYLVTDEARVQTIYEHLKLDDAVDAVDGTFKFNFVTNGVIHEPRPVSPMKTTRPAHTETEQDVIPLDPDAKRFDFALLKFLPYFYFCKFVVCLHNLDIFLCSPTERTAGDHVKTMEGLPKFYGMNERHLVARTLSRPEYPVHRVFDLSSYFDENNNDHVMYLKVRFFHIFCFVNTTSNWMYCPSTEND